MKQVFNDYLEIYTRYPLNAPLRKDQKKLRHELLMNWENTVYTEMPNIMEIKHFIDENTTLKFTDPFYEKIVLPCVDLDIEQGNIEALLFLFEQIPENEIGHRLRLYCRYKGWSTNDDKLVNMVLSREPNNRIVQTYKFNLKKGYLEYSIHEVPLFIIDSPENVTDEEFKQHQHELMPELKKDLEEFRQLSVILDKKEDELINKCQAYYPAWEDYLKHKSAYKNFEDYLDQHHIKHKK